MLDLWSHTICIPCCKPLLLRVRSNLCGLIRNAESKAPPQTLLNQNLHFNKDFLVMLIVEFEKHCYKSQSIIPNHSEHQDHLENFSLVDFIPMSKAPARFTEIRIPGMGCSVCQINARCKIFLCIFEKYRFQFGWKKANYVILLWSSE